MMTEDLENELRNIMARSADGIMIPEQARTRLLRRDYHPRRVNRALAAGIAAAAAAAVIAVPLAASTGSPRLTPRAAITLAAHTFQMPDGYQPAAAKSPACRPFSIINGLPGQNGARQPRPAATQALRAAASAAGGCIVLTLTKPYTPTTAAPDPYAYSTAQPVQFGSYHGYLSHESVLVFPGDTGYLKPGWHTATDLDVQLPTGHGKMRDLVIGATGLTDPALIKIATSGLSS